MWMAKYLWVMSPAHVMLLLVALVVTGLAPWAGASETPNIFEPTQQLDRRSASLTVPIPSSTSTMETGSFGTIGTTGTSSATMLSPVPTTTTVLTTSEGPNGTSVFTTTVTTLVVPGSTSTGNGTGTLASGTTTTTAFPSLSTFSPCVTNCLDVAVGSVNCSSPTDIACYCTSSNFTQSLFSCVTDQCSSELTSAENLAQEFCNLQSPSVSLSFPSTSANATAASTSSGTSTSTSSAAFSFRTRLDGCIIMVLFMNLGFVILFVFSAGFCILV